jgi:hypothetical protein
MSTREVIGVSLYLVLLFTPIFRSLQGDLVKEVRTPGEIAVIDFVRAIGRTKSKAGYG